MQYKSMMRMKAKDPYLAEMRLEQDRNTHDLMCAADLSSDESHDEVYWEDKIEQYTR
jgi:hypothetical protein